MAAQDTQEQGAHLSARELAHLRARDRKRTTRMVVDNAGVKRILLARRDRAAQRSRGTGQAEGHSTT
jgi:hypothetical protein